MKTTMLMTAVAMMAMSAFAADSAATGTGTAPTPAPAATTTAAKPATDSTCITPDCGAEWLNIDTVTVEAANGDPLAQYTLAWLSDTGSIGTAKDPDKAKDLYTKAAPGLEKAAKSGNACAAKALSRMYAEGKGVTKDEAKAAEYKAHAEKCCKDGKDAKKCCEPKGDKAN